MSCTREQLRMKIIRALGGSMVKVELCIEDIDDAINMARDYFITWAVGNATQEVYFLVMLKGGQYLYELPIGVVDIVNYHDHFGGMGGGMDGACGYNPMWYTGPEQGSTAFYSIQNPASHGMGYGMAGQTNDGSMSGSPYGFVDLYVARTTMQLVHNLRADKYQWRYHKLTNQLEIIPTPTCGNTLTKVTPSGDVYDIPSAAYPCPSGAYETENFDSPGYILVRSYMMEGSTLPTYTPAISGANDVDACSMYPDIGTQLSEYLWSHPWIFNYAVALSKQRLGIIRRKYANGSAMGGASITLDGDTMYSEGHDDQIRLEEEVDSKWSFEGFGVSMG